VDSGFDQEVGLEPPSRENTHQTRFIQVPGLSLPFYALPDVFYHVLLLLPLLLLELLQKTYQPEAVVGTGLERSRAQAT